MLTMKDLSIHPPFAAVFEDDPHEEWQVAAMEAEIRRSKEWDTIYHWRGLVADGHTRYAIWQKISAEDQDFPEPTIVELVRETEAEVIEWIKARQANRRNLNTNRLRYHRGKKLMAAMEEGSAGKPEGHPRKGHKSPRKSKAGKPVEDLAKELKVSRASVYRDEQYAKSVDSLAARGVAKQEELMKHTPTQVIKAAQQSTNSEAAKVLEKNVNRQAAGEHTDVAKRFAVVSKAIQKLHEDYPNTKLWREIDDALHEWCDQITNRRN